MTKWAHRYGAMQNMMPFEDDKHILPVCECTQVQVIKFLTGVILANHM